eukprot:GAHX01008667.1.p1 GENE.GAHX01008667.1~~GAHX01008667.1.p1  ORF type:complete len:60 (-),score=2.82 GAHX01008667.1:49-228(-)
MILKSQLKLCKAHIRKRYLLIISFQDFSKECRELNHGDEAFVLESIRYTVRNSSNCEEI